MSSISAEEIIINRLDEAEIFVNGGKIYIANFPKLKKISQRVVKMIDFLCVKLGEQNTFRGEVNRLEIRLTLDEYMEFMGTANPQNKNVRKEARKRLKQDFEVLYNLSLEWTENAKKQNKNFMKMRLFDAYGIKNSIAWIKFSQDFATYLNHSYVIDFPKKLFSLGERNKNVYPIGRKLSLHYSLSSNKKRGTNNLLSVSKILDCAPAIPLYEEVMDSNRNWRGRIMESLEHVLDLLASEKIIEWEYAKTGGSPLKEEEVDIGHFEDFIRLYIKFRMIP